MTKRSTIQITVLRQDQYEAGPFDFGADYEPGSLDRVIKSLLAIRKSIPEEFRETAGCEIRSVERSGDCWPTISVVYLRPVTDAEQAECDARETAWRLERRAEKRALLEKLKAELGETG